MIRALVFDTDAPFQGEGARLSPVAADTRLAGLTLLRRQILMAWRLGAESCVVATHTEEGRRYCVDREKDPRIPVTVVGPGSELPLIAADDWVVILSAQVLPKPELLERLLATARATGRSVVAQATSQSSWGPAVVSGADLRSVTSAGTPAAAVRALLPRCETLVVEVRAYRRLDGKGAVEEADRSMYQGLTSISDGYVDRILNRHISRRFTRLVINTPVTPNAVTWLHFSLGLLAAWCLWRPGYESQLLGALLLQLSAALDCSDGEVARLKYQFSKFGSWLDVATDNIVTVAVFAAVARSAAVFLGVPVATVLGILAVTGVLMSVLVVFSMAKLQERLRPGEASALVVTNRLSTNDQAKATRSAGLVAAVINEATSRDHTLLVVFFALLGKLEWFAWLAGVGSHVFWIVFASIQLHMLRGANAQSR